MPETGKTGPEMLDEATQEPTLDRYLDNIPRNVSYEELVTRLQQKRVWNITKKEEKTNANEDQA